MTWKSLRAAKFASICLFCLPPHTPVFPAQEPDTLASEIFGHPTHHQIKLPDGAVEYSDQDIGMSFAMPRDWGLGHDGLRFLDRGWRGSGDGNIATTVFLHRRHTDVGIELYY